jgi:hypothetical protein
LLGDVRQPKARHIPSEFTMKSARAGQAAKARVTARGETLH